MSVLDRDALSASPLADLHAIASELGLDGFRRLRKAELVDAIVARQGGAEDAGEEAEEKPRRRRSRGGRGRSAAAKRDDPDEQSGADEEPAGKPEKSEKPARTRAQRARKAQQETAAEREERTVEGALELVDNGSGFIRLNAPETSDEDVYVSAAQVRRCELVAGDTVGGPVRAPRRSERYPSLVRVETINGRPADEVAAGTPYEQLACAPPSERIELGGGDAALEAIDRLAPIGKGSRVTIAGGPLAGKTETLRRIAAALGGRDGLEVAVVLAGVRPEEVAGWEQQDALGFAASPEEQARAIERAVEEGRRIAARGGDAVVLIDTLAYLPPHTARAALAAARNLTEAGSLTVIATASAPLGGETTILTLDAARARAGEAPALDAAATASLRPDLLAGEQGAARTAQAHAETDGAASDAQDGGAPAGGLRRSSWRR